MCGVGYQKLCNFPEDARSRGCPSSGLEVVLYCTPGICLARFRGFTFDDLIIVQGVYNYCITKRFVCRRVVITSVAALPVESISS